jgi:hypothetical protein
MDRRFPAECTEMGHRATSWTLGRFPWQLFSFIVCGQKDPEFKNRHVGGDDPDNP